jgi:hypothetical protein
LACALAISSPTSWGPGTPTFSVHEREPTVTYTAERKRAAIHFMFLTRSEVLSRIVVQLKSPEDPA